MANAKNNQKTAKRKIDKPMAWIKSLLNNITLIKWVKKFSADNLLEDNKLSEKFGVACGEESISVGDNTLTKLLVTQAKYDGKEFSRYNVKQIKEAVDLLGSGGELIISEENNRELFIQIGDTVVIVSPLPKTDGKE